MHHLHANSSHTSYKTYRNVGPDRNILSDGYNEIFVFQLKPNDVFCLFIIYCQAKMLNFSLFQRLRCKDLLTTTTLHLILL